MSFHFASGITWAQGQTSTGHSPQSRIFYATPVTATNVPSARLIIHSDTGTALSSSVVIDSTTLISAAHCFSQGTTRHIEVTASDGTQAFGIIYSVDPSNDLSYVKLDRKISKRIKPVKLATRPPIYGENILIFGYGRDEHGNLGTLGAATMRVVSSNGRMIFALRMPGGGNACNGDSGGPAFTIRKGKPYFVGVGSVGDKDCTLGVAGYSSVLSTSARQFLKAALKKPKKPK